MSTPNKNGMTIQTGQKGGPTSIIIRFKVYEEKKRKARWLWLRRT
jgi:hypothetical protein